MRYPLEKKKLFCRKAFSCNMACLFPQVSDNLFDILIAPHVNKLKANY